jgi:hypothetical protein
MIYLRREHCMPLLRISNYVLEKKRSINVFLMNKMKINITNQQYETIIKALDISNSIYGLMTDMVDEKYKPISSKHEKVLEELLEYAKDYGFDKNTEKFKGKNILKEKYNMETLDDLEEYEELELFDKLSNKLGIRDFREKYSEEEIKKISKEHGGYLGVPLYDFEKKYYDEFNKNEYNRLYIRK